MTLRLLPIIAIYRAFVSTAHFNTRMSSRCPRVTITMYEVSLIWQFRKDLFVLVRVDLIGFGEPLAICEHLAVIDHHRAETGKIRDL